ncbi:MAG: hypothetical protein WEB56_07340 [Roseovarius sp.]
MNYFAIGFGVVALTALGAIDYANQANAAGKAPGQFSPGAYFATYGARVEGLRTARAEATAASERQARRKAGARVYLPKAPEGWTRRAWLDGDNSAIEKAPDEAQHDVPEILKNMGAKSARASEERRDAQTWVYQRGEQIIAVRAEYKPREGARTLVGAMGDTLAAFPIFADSEGWDVIGGVAYGRLPGKLGASSQISGNDTPFMAYEAPMGFHDSIRLRIESNAEDEADLRNILARIDYDGLNSLLSYPLAYVGANAPQIPQDSAPEVAGMMLELHGELLDRRSAAAQAWMERAITPENVMKMALNEIAHGWGVGSIKALEPAEDPAPEADGHAEVAPSAPAAPLKAIKSFAGSIMGGGKARATAQAEEPPKAKPTRLTLSGGSSCLEGSAGRFCRD